MTDQYTLLENNKYECRSCKSVVCKSSIYSHLQTKKHLKRECDICCERQDTFIACMQCQKETCQRCVARAQTIHGYKCPYCRYEYPTSEMKRAILLCNLPKIRDLLDKGFSPNFIFKSGTNEYMNLIQFSRMYRHSDEIIAYLYGRGVNDIRFKPSRDMVLMDLKNSVMISRDMLNYFIDNTNYLARHQNSLI